MNHATLIGLTALGAVAGDGVTSALGLDYARLGVYAVTVSVLIWVVIDLRKQRDKLQEDLAEDRNAAKEVYELAIQKAEEGKEKRQEHERQRIEADLQKADALKVLGEGVSRLAEVVKARPE